MQLPRRLVAPAPGWSVSTDVVVVGSGVAGLSAALHASRAGRVLLVTKQLLDDGSTRWAQGGIAAALGDDDTPELHLQDTLTAGVGICDPDAVGVLVTEGPARVRELLAIGGVFDPAHGGPTSPEGLALAREGGHSRRRIVHAGGDATGMEVQRALLAAVRSNPSIEIIEHALVVDLLRTSDNAVCGLTLHVLETGTHDGVGAVHARAVVLATGGLGQIFSSTTNPAVSTGDGVAVALRAGAEVADLEFVQFHPTALWLGPSSRGQQPLITEAMRGEGAFLVDADGERVMTGVHPLADLVPRDVVAKAMSRRMAELRTDHLFLDARGIGETELLHHFPSIVARCREAGVDPVTDLIPVAPAAHYASGGVITDLMGRTTVRGLYACGEVACTGVHGANRLASNSLLEGLVFAGRIGAALAADLDELPETAAAEDLSPSSLLEPSAREEIQRAMTDGAGVLRSSHSLAATAKSLASVSAPRDGAAEPTPAPDAWQTTDLHTVASAVVQAASMREETRGCHWREDHPDAEGAFLGHLVSRLASDGTLETEFRPGPGLSAIVSA